MSAVPPPGVDEADTTEQVGDGQGVSARSMESAPGQFNTVAHSAQAPRATGILVTHNNNAVRQRRKIYYNPEGTYRGPNFGREELAKDSLVTPLSVQDAPPHHREYKGTHSLRINLSLAVVSTSIHPSNPHRTTYSMRFLAQVHPLVVFGMLSLGITPYAQSCSQNVDCDPNHCCLSGRLGARCIPLAREGESCTAITSCGCLEDLDMSAATVPLPPRDDGPDDPEGPEGGPET
ncbi:hypothetical protein DFH08DRAFT_813446 [Mycena albidolilacea]|uniref:Uncharacterized protein n=1 Tax=Mycena albidolilacea TaxID=1033008 RepID=A0AAD6ZRM2_9AGAR|nr:hypothetical protein DFH08DRAFT_813446 [Mycena albidolilacea]